jgi:lysozyme
MTAVCVPTSPIPGLEGIDISKFQGPIDWHAVAAAAIAFGWIREGESDWSTADERWVENWANARAADFFAGPYHAIHGGVDPRTQARILRDRCKDFRPGLDLAPMVDWEVAGGGHEPEELAAFLDEGERLFQTQFFVYTGPGFADRWAPARELAIATRPLIVAHYGVRRPTIPRAWSSAIGWQYAGDNGCSVPGITSPRVDHDVFFGSLDQLKVLLRAMAFQKSSGPAEGSRAESIVAALNASFIADPA